MKIHFRVDQAESFRRGINASDPIVALDIDPARLTGYQRQLIGGHLLGTCVVHDPQRATNLHEAVPVGGRAGDELIEAKEPTLGSLIVALEALGSRLSGETRLAPDQTSATRAYVTCNKATLRRRHYLQFARVGTHFFNFHLGTFNKKRAQYGDNFALIISCSDVLDDSYVLPLSEFKPFFSEDYLIGASLDDPHRYRWRGNVYNDRLHLYGSRMPTRTRAVAEFHNAFKLLEQQRHLE